MRKRANRDLCSVRISGEEPTAASRLLLPQDGLNHIGNPPLPSEDTTPETNPVTRKDSSFMQN